MGKRRHRQTEEYRSPDWKRRLFNGYVAAPLDNYIVLLLSAIGISGLAICAMVMLFQDAAIPENQTQVIFEDVFIVCTGLVFFAWGGFAGLYYVVSNAERFPRLAKLMIRKEFRRF